jgi:hypothetical protein
VEQQDAIIDCYFEVSKQVFICMGPEEHYRMMHKGQKEDDLVTASLFKRNRSK